jgi:formylglycine-generating enzyme required for sulfatase activity
MKPPWVEIPAGSFLMGGVPDDKFVSAVEMPRHEVKIKKSFALGVFPVTRGEWFETEVPDPDLPVTGVDFSEIQSYMKRLTRAQGISFRLPSEAEWEYACRAGSDTVFPDGGNLEPEQANFLYDESGETIGRGELTPRGFYPPNNFGLHDMLGNVCEWTADVWYPDFHGAPADGSPRLHGEKPDRRVIRGGAWDHLPRVLRASWRDWAPESARWDNLGFRIAFTL